VDKELKKSETKRIIIQLLQNLNELQGTTTKNPHIGHEASKGEECH
jgi:hypothetical protein